MRPDDARAASALLVESWHQGRKLRELPAALRPRTRADGYTIQAQLETMSAAPLYGWKIAATSAAGQEHIGVDGPLAGRILQERVLAPDAEASLDGNLMRVAEVEFAFRMRRDLPPRGKPYTADEVMAAVADLHPAIELPDSRFTDFAQMGAPHLIADDACAHLLVVGEPAPAAWRALALASHPVVGRITSGAEQRGSGADVLGDPRLALTWLANELAANGLTLRAGQVVSTGTATVPVALRPGDTFTADLGVVGTVSVRLA